ncbi:MAG TPA: hypothetical protein DCY07_01535 [Rhodospirillaceae bacterium]|nr:hypothetical protein [Rhodospirillaceae bacterium]
MNARTNIIIVHGTGGSPEGNWFPWMKVELEALGGHVLVPRFPTPEGQSFEAWREVFLRVANGLRKENTILIGHSIGAPFVMRMAEESEGPYKAIFPICPFTKTLGCCFDELNATFVDNVYDWDRVKAGAKHRLCFAGDDDPYVPLSFSQEAATKMEVELRIIPKGGHLNAEFGYLSFPQLLVEVELLS